MFKYCGFQVEKARFCEIKFAEKFIDQGGRLMYKTGELECTWFNNGFVSIFTLRTEESEREFLRVIKSNPKNK